MHPIALRHFHAVERTQPNASVRSAQVRTARRLPGGEKFFALLSLTASVVAIILICLGANRSAADGPGHSLLSLGVSDGVPSAPRQADMGSFSGY